MRSCCIRYDHTEYFQPPASYICNTSWWTEFKAKRGTLSLSNFFLLAITDIHNTAMSSRELCKCAKLFFVVALAVACVAVVLLSMIEALFRLLSAASCLPFCFFALYLDRGHIVSNLSIVLFSSALFTAIQGPYALSILYDVLTKHSNVTLDRDMERRLWNIPRNRPL